jgi:hypothetical protein
MLEGVKQLLSGAVYVDDDSQIPSFYNLNRWIQ